MDLNIILIMLMLAALFLSLVAIIMVVVFLLKTNTKIKSFFRLSRFFYLNNFIEKGLKRNENQYTDPEMLYQDYMLKKPVKSINK
ncbi:MAG: hypothetical protein FJW68_00545 [Actinobacteria bacterium]|nr:hypothetical protein [Actinomycetota bacterium]